MQDDGLPHLRSQLRRSAAALPATDPRTPRVVEAFPQGYPEFKQTRPGLTFWQWCARVIPVVIAITSTSVLGYYFFVEHRPQLIGQSEPRSEQSSGEQTSSAQTESAATPTKQQQAQAQPAPAQEQEPHAQSSPAAPPPDLQDLGPRLPMPSDDVLLMLIESSVMALNQANTTGNYSVLREIGAPAFQNANSVERLAQLFAPLRSRNLDLSPILLIQPKLFRAPEMNAKGMIRVMGFFPTSPERVNFDLIFQPVQSRWRLFGIAVSTRPAPPATQRQSPPDEKPTTEEPKAEAQPKPESEPTKPAAAKKPAAKPKPAAEAQEPAPDVRDRIDNPPAPPPAEKPKQKSGWNPFGR
jgi:hypothetical protein